MEASYGLVQLAAERNRITSLMLDENARITINNISIHESLGMRSGSGM
jgi:hypothetical protein